MRKLTFLLFLLLICTNAPAQDRWVSPPEQVLLVELYTSEGCSSCPPVDRWFSTLVDAPDLWTRFVPVAFHVDYWNGLGWRDRFSLPEYSERQRRYREEGGIDVVYTPGIVRNGREWRNFHWQPLPDVRGMSVGVLSANFEEAFVEITFEPVTGVATEGLVAHLGLLGSGLETSVRRGENAGRELHHDFVLLHWDQVVMQRQQTSAGDLRFRTKVRQPVSNRNVPRRALAIWVTTNSSQAPIQALGGWLD